MASIMYSRKARSIPTTPPNTLNARNRVTQATASTPIITDRSTPAKTPRTPTSKSTESPALFTSHSNERRARGSIVVFRNPNGIFMPTRRLDSFTSRSSWEPSRSVHFRNLIKAALVKNQGVAEESISEALLDLEDRIRTRYVVYAKFPPSASPQLNPISTHSDYEALLCESRTMAVPAKTMGAAIRKPYCTTFSNLPRFPISNAANEITPPTTSQDPPTRLWNIDSIVASKVDPGPVRTATHEVRGSSFRNRKTAWNASVACRAPRTIVIAITALNMTVSLQMPLMVSTTVLFRKRVVGKLTASRAPRWS